MEEGDDEGVCPILWCDIDLTFHLIVVTLTINILSGHYLKTCKV